MAEITLQSLWRLPSCNLFFRGPRSNLSDRPNEDYSTLVVWHNVRAKYHSPLTISPHTPLWGNPTLSHLRSISDPSLWAARVVRLKYIMSDGRLMGFSNLKAKYNLSNLPFYNFISNHMFEIHAELLGSL